MSSENQLLLLSTTSQIGGTERMVLALARGALDLGFDVKTLLAEDSGVAATLDWFRREGVPAAASSAVLTIYRRHDLRSMLELWRTVRKSGASAVNIHYGGSHFSLKDVISIRCAGVRKCVVSVHHTNRIGTARRRAMTRMAAGFVHAIVVTTDVAKDVLLEAKVPKRKIHVIPPALKPPDKLRSRAEARQLLGLPSDAFVVGCLARLTPQKGVGDLIDGVAKVPDPDRRLRLVVAGDGEARSELEQRAKASLQERAVFTGWIEDPANVYAASDVFALPSLMEGFGLVYIEAAYYGVPSVATRVGGIPLAIKDGVTGLLVELRDVEALGAAIARLRDDPELRRRLGEAARSRAEQEFSGRGMAERYCRVLFPEAAQDHAGEALRAPTL